MPDSINEEFAARHFLKAIGISDETFMHRDKPDFIIQYENQIIGLEVSNVAPEEYQRSTRWLHRYRKEGCIYTGNLQFRAERRPTSELIGEITHNNGQWQDGAEIHEQWIMGIEHRLREKERAFTSAEFSRFDQNWLLLSDVEVAPVNHESDISFMVQNLLQLKSVFAPVDYFEKVWIDFGSGEIVEWSISKGEMTWKNLRLPERIIY